MALIPAEPTIHAHARDLGSKNCMRLPRSFTISTNLQSRVGLVQHGRVQCSVVSKEEGLGNSCRCCCCLTLWAYTSSRRMAKRAASPGTAVSWIQLRILNRNNYRIGNRDRRPPCKKETLTANLLTMIAV